MPKGKKSGRFDVLRKSAIYECRIFFIISGLKNEIHTLPYTQTHIYPHKCKEKSIEKQTVTHNILISLRLNTKTNIISFFLMKLFSSFLSVYFLFFFTDITITRLSPLNYCGKRYKRLIYYLL